jgi:hypothetical protein
MYKINVETNELIPLDKKTFSESKFRERDHLQEWIAKDPSVLGEELLILQKEFEGFEDTKDRFDLLALDKQGNLVIIENKRDDSGKDVVWQALKYASYCSTLSTSEIIDMLREYKDDENFDAEEAIKDFINSEEQELELNEGLGQRIIFVAAKFRKEVTSTALWLMENGLQIQCFQSSLYAYAGDYFFNIEQILPVPNTEDMVIRKANKERENQQNKSTKARVAQQYSPFWQRLFKQMPNETLTYPFKDTDCHGQDLKVKIPVKGVYVEIVLTSKQARIQLDPKGHQDTRGVALYQWLKANKSVFDVALGQATVLYDKNEGSGRLGLEFNKDCSNPENWDEIIEWLATYLPLFQKTVEHHEDEINHYLSENAGF